MRAVYALVAITVIVIGCHKQMRPQLDESKAKDYVGKTVLIRVTYLDHEERQTGQQQWYGVITEVSNAKGSRRERVTAQSRLQILAAVWSGLGPQKRGSASSKIRFRPFHACSWSSRG